MAATISSRRKAGWKRRPIRAPAIWKMHPDWDLGDVGFIYVRDVNGDGRPDIVTSMAHNYGIFWLEHKADGKWAKHIIDESWSQPHAMTLVDFRGNRQNRTAHRQALHGPQRPRSGRARAAGCLLV